MVLKYTYLHQIHKKHCPRFIAKHNMFCKRTVSRQQCFSKLLNCTAKLSNSEGYGQIAGAGGALGTDKSNPPFLPSEAFLRNLSWILLVNPRSLQTAVREPPKGRFHTRYGLQTGLDSSQVALCC